LSGNSDHLLQGDSVKRPTYLFAAQNNLNVASFDGTDDFLQLASDFSLGTAHSIFIACKNAATITAASSTQAILSGGSYVYPSTTTSDFLFTTGSTTGNITNERISSLVIAHSASAAQVYGRAKANADIESGFIVSTAYTTAADAFRGRYQGADDFVALSSAGSFSSGNTRYPTLLRTVGSRAGTSQFWNGQIWEVVVFASYLSQENTELIEGYLAQKWGLQESLPSTHPYKYNLLSSKFRSRSFFTRYAYKPDKPRNYSVIRNRDPNYSTLRQGLVAAYCPSISGQGNVLPDLVGGNHGTLTNMDASDWVSSGDGRALDFDGSNDNVRVAFARPSFPFTLSCWALTTTDTTNEYSLVLCRSGADDGQFSILWGGAIAGDYIYARHESDVGGALVAARSQNAFTTNKWTHVVAVFRSNTYRQIYVDGLAGIEDTTNVATPSVDRLAIGRLDRLNPGGAFLGQIDDCRVYSRELSEPEIKLLASKRGIGLRQESHRQTFYQFPSGARRRRILTGMP
jgi:hypothetical protein